MRFTKKIFFVLILSFLFFNITSAQNTNDALRLVEPGLGIGVRALGMGNAFLSLSDDASGMYYNPAGIGLIKRIEFSGGLDYLNFKNNTTFLRSSNEYSNSSTQLNQLSLVFPFPTVRGSLVFGFSYNNIKNFTDALKFDGFNSSNTSFIQQETSYNSDFMYNLGLSYPVYDVNNKYLYDTTIINGRLTQSGEKLSSGSINNWGFSAAIEVYKNLFIGGTLNVISGSYKSSFDYYEEDLNNVYSSYQLDPADPKTKGFKTFYISRITDWELSGWDFKLGFLYQLSNLARVAATIQFPKSFTVKEKFAADGWAEFANNTYYLPHPEDYKDEVKYDIISPFSFNLGSSVNYKGLIASFEVGLTDYSQTEFDNAENFTNPEKFITDRNKLIKQQLKATANFNLGLEYTIPDIGLRVRGGYILQPSAFKDDPSDFDKKFITAGIGFLADETVSIDFAFAHGWWKTYGDNYGNNVSRTFQEIAVNKLLVGFSYRF